MLQMTPSNLEVYLDFETWGRADLPRVGAVSYSKHPDTRVHVVTWAVADGPVKLCNFSLDIPSHVERSSEEELLADCESASAIYAHNVAFDRSIWENTLGLPTDLPWRCTRIAADAMGMPGSLDGLGHFFSFGEKKKGGAKVLKKFIKSKEYPSSVPGEEMAMFLDYARQDVVLLRRVARSKPFQWFFRQDDLVRIADVAWQMNRDGVAVDTELVEKIIPLVEAFDEENAETLSRITGGVITSAQQYIRAKNFINFNLGIEVDNASAETLVQLLKHPEEYVRDFASTMLEVRNSSKGKFKAMLNMAQDGRLCGMMRVFGAATHRWASSGVQLQNMPRGASASDGVLSKALDAVRKGTTLGGVASTLGCDKSSALKTLVRPCLVPKKDCFISADYTQIELRILSWLCGQEDVLRQLAKGEDVYRLTAARVYQKPVDEVTDQERYVGKVMELALGYSMGAAKFKRQFTVHGIDLNPGDFGLAKNEDPYAYLVDIYRENHAEVRKAWWEANTALVNLEENGREKILGRVVLEYKTHVHNCMRMTLPSGTKRFYWRFRVEDEEVPGIGTRRRARYMRYRNYTTSDLYGGLLVENICQSLAADILNRAMVRLSEEGFDTVFSVHDEIVLDCRKKGIEGQLDRIREIMSDGGEWAKDIPLRVDMKTLPFYRK